MEFDIFWDIIKESKGESWGPLLFLSSRIYDAPELRKWRKVWALQGKKIDDIAGNLSDIEMLLWLRNGDIYTIRYMFTYILSQKRFGLIKSLFENFPIRRREVKSNLFIYIHPVVKGCDLETLKWVIGKYKLVREDFTANNYNIYTWVAFYGSVQTMQWLVTQIGWIPADSQCAYSAISNGSIHMIEWIAEQSHMYVDSSALWNAAKKWASPSN